MTTLYSSTRAVASGDDLGEVPIDDAHLAAAAFLARYRARTLEATGMTFGSSSNGPTITASTCSPPPDPKSSCTYGPWKSVAWRRQPSTGASRPSADCTASLTSTGASRRTPPSRETFLGSVVFGSPGA